MTDTAAPVTPLVPVANDGLLKLRQAGVQFPPTMTQRGPNDAMTQAFWGGAEEFGGPLLGPANQPLPALKAEELESRLGNAARAWCMQFDLSVPDEKAAYEALLTLVCQSWATVYHREHLPTTVKTVSPDGCSVEKSHMTVYVEWFQPLKYIKDEQTY